MLPDRVSNPGPLTYESGALPIALRGPAYQIHYRPRLSTDPRGESIQLFHAGGNIPICRPELLWTTRCTIKRGRQAEGDSVSGRPRNRGAIDLTFARTGREKSCFITKKNAKLCNHYAKKLDTLDIM